MLHQKCNSKTRRGKEKELEESQTLKKQKSSYEK